jgi:predicted transcriptional regulator
MQDQRSDADLALRDDEVERTVLTLLLESRVPGQWSVDELAREIGGEMETTDAIVRLHAAGLVHRCHEFVWVTRAAARFHQLGFAA